MRKIDNQEQHKTNPPPYIDILSDDDDEYHQTVEPPISFKYDNDQSKFRVGRTKYTNPQPNYKLQDYTMPQSYLTKDQSPTQQPEIPEDVFNQKNKQLSKGKIRRKNNNYISDVNIQNKTQNRNKYFIGLEMGTNRYAQTTTPSKQQIKSAYSQLQQLYGSINTSSLITKLYNQSILKGRLINGSLKPNILFNFVDFTLQHAVILRQNDVISFRCNRFKRNPSPQHQNQFQRRKILAQSFCIYGYNFNSYKKEVIEIGNPLYLIQDKTRYEYLLRSIVIYGKGQNKADTFSKSGRRHQLLENLYLKQVKMSIDEQQRKKQEEARKGVFQTTNKATFTQKPLNQNSIGKLVMYDQSGRNVDLANVDEDMRQTLGFKERGQITRDEELRKLVDTSTGYERAQPVTFWREKAEDGTFYMSKNGNGEQPFAKNNQFLKTFQHYKHNKD